MAPPRWVHWWGGGIFDQRDAGRVVDVRARGMGDGGAGILRAARAPHQGHALEKVGRAPGQRNVQTTLRLRPCKSGPPRQGSATMNVEELKKEVAALDREKQGELAAFLVSLRNSRDPAYRAAMQERMNEKNPARWLTPDQFEQRLGAS